MQENSNIGLYKQSATHVDTLALSLKPFGSLLSRRLSRRCEEGTYSRRGNLVNLRWRDCFANARKNAQLNSERISAGAPWHNVPQPVLTSKTTLLRVADNPRQQREESRSKCAGDASASPQHDVKSNASTPLRLLSSSFAFTLAEVLITLGIIGVVAAMTIPTIIANSKKQELVSLFKKEYSEISNAWQQVITDNGGSIVGVFADSDKALDAICSKLKCIEKCYSAEDPTKCAVPIEKTKSLDGTSAWSMTVTGSIGVLANGAVFGLSGWTPNCTIARYKNSSCSNLSFDTTGLKGPNVVGLDIFELWINQNNIAPTGVAGESFGDAIGGNLALGCDSSSTTLTYNGATCGARILIENGMDY